MQHKVKTGNRQLVLFVCMCVHICMYIALTYTLQKCILLPDQLYFTKPSSLLTVIYRKASLYRTVFKLIALHFSKSPW